MSSSVVTALASIVLVLGGGSGIAALLLVRRQMRVLSATADSKDADAGKTLSTAAIELIAPYREQVAEARAEAKEASRQAEKANLRADKAERRIARLEALGGLHMLWDEEAQAEVQRLGGNLRQPPRLDDLVDTP